MGAWPETFRAVVFPWHCDQFGHMNVRWYAHFFDDAGFHIWSVHGFGLKRMEALGLHTVVARTSIDYKRELKAGDLIVIRSAFTRLGTKSITHLQHMLNADTGVLHAVQETVEVFFDPETRTAIPVPDEIAQMVGSALVSPETSAA